jgi:hypothetical protein
VQLLYLRRYSTPWELTGTAAYVAIARCGSGQGAATSLAKVRRGSRYATATYVGIANTFVDIARRGSGYSTYVAMARHGVNMVELYIWL